MQQGFVLLSAVMSVQVEKLCPPFSESIFGLYANRVFSGHEVAPVPILNNIVILDMHK